MGKGSFVVPVGVLTFHFFRLSPASAMRSVPKPQPKMSDFVLPAIANPARPPRATKSPHGNVRQKSCMGNHEGRPFLFLSASTEEEAFTEPPDAAKVTREERPPVAPPFDWRMRALGR